MSNANSLRPGQSITLSDVNGVRTIAERSTVGGILRIVRVTANGFEVVRSTKRWPS
jgi:hypothetical protein